MAGKYDLDDIKKALGSGRKGKRSSVAPTVEAMITNETTNVSFANVPEGLIPLDLIREREVNEFSETDITSLKNSIYLYGLVHQIAVSRPENGQKEEYTIISGHRRFQAVKQLHSQHPEDERFSRINCVIYTVTDDPEKLDRSRGYISAEEEEAMYKDANFESRQIQFTDTLKHADYLIAKIDSMREDELREAIRQTREGQEIKRETKKLNRAEYISDVLTNQMKFPGWSVGQVKKYLTLKDKASDEMMMKIRNGEVSIKAAYTAIENKEKKPEKTKEKSGSSMAGKQLKDKAKTLRSSVKSIASEVTKSGAGRDILKSLKDTAEALDKLIKEIEKEL